MDGISSGSYGINVARIAGLSERLLRLARERSQWMLERCSLSHGDDDDHGDDNASKRVSALADSHAGSCSIGDEVEAAAYQILRDMRELLLLRWDSNKDSGSSGSSSSGSSSSSSSSNGDSYNDNGRKRARYSEDLDSAERKFASFIEAAANIVNRTTTAETSSGGAIHH